MQGYFDNVSQSLNNIGSQLQMIGGMLTGAGGIGLAGVAGAMTGLLKPAADLQEQLANVNTLFSDTKFQADEYRDAILQLSRSVPKSTKTLTEGLYQIKSAGIEAEDTLGFLKTASVAATAGLTDVGTTVSALTKVIRGFGLEGQDVLSVANKLFSTVEIGQTTFGELAQSIPSVTAAAANAGLSIDEMLGAFASGTKILKDSRQTAVGLAGMLRSIGKASDDQKELAKELGFEFSQQALEAKGLTEFLGDMREALEGTNVSIREFFRREQGYRLAVALLGDSYEMLSKNINDVAESQGAINKAFGKQMDTFNNQARLAWNNVIATAKAIGSELLPRYTDLAETVNAVTEAIGNRFVKASDEEKESMVDLIDTIIRFTAKVFGAITGLGILALTLGTVSKVAGLVAGIFAMMTSPIGLLILFVSGLWLAWEQNLGNIREYTSEVFNDIEQHAKGLKTWFENNDILKNLQISFNNSEIVDEFEKNFEEIKNIWKDKKLSLPEKTLETVGVIIDTLKVTAIKSFEWIKGIFGDRTPEQEVASAIGNRGMGSLLESIYKAEGGEKARVPYGATGFSDQGGFNKKENQERFNKIISDLDIEEGTKQYYAAAAATTVEYYWEQFRKKYGLEADTQIAELSKDTRDKFIDYLGKRYAPESAAEINKHWPTNVKQLIGDSSGQSKAQATIKSIGVKIKNIAWDISKDIASGLRLAIIQIVDSNDDGVADLDEQLDFGINATITLGSIALAFSGTKLISAILAEMAGLSIAGLQLGGLGTAAAAAGITIGAVLSITLDPEIDNFDEWKTRFKQGLKTLFSESFWNSIWDSMETTWDNAWEDMLDVASEIKNKITKPLEEALEAIKEWFAKSESTDSKLGKIYDVPGYATGGQVSGKGTKKSDSIMARISNGEFIVNAQATEKYLPLLQAINNESLPGFADGGFIGGVSGNFSEIPQNVFNVMKAMFDKMFDSIFEVLGDYIPDKLKEEIQQLRDDYDNILSGMREENDLSDEDEEEQSKKQKSWFGRIADNFKEFMGSIGESVKELRQEIGQGMAQILVSGENFGQQLENMFRNIFDRIAIKILNQKLIQPLIDAVVGLFTAHEGGMVGKSGIQHFKTGGKVGLNSKERMVKTEVGEMILNQNQQDALGQALGQGAGGGINILIQANDAKSFQEMLQNNNAKVKQIISQDILSNGQIRKIIKQNL